MSVRKRLTFSSNESDNFQEPERKPKKKSRKKSIRKKSSSEDDPEIKIEIEEEMKIESEISISESELDEDNRPGSSNASRSAKELANPKGTFTIEELSSDDEVFFFQCPHNVNIESLLNVELDENTQIQDKDSGNVYNFKIDKLDDKTITCAFPSSQGEAKLVNLPVKGHMIVERVVHVPSVKLTKDKNRNVEFPKDLKVRHPLLGVDWEEHIRRSDEMIKKFNAVKKDENFEDGEKCKSGKKRKKRRR